MGASLIAIAAGVLGWLLGWLWAAGCAVALMALVVRVSRSRSLLVDGERIVPVIGRVQRRPIWWDTVDAMYVDRRRPPKGIGSIDEDAAPDELPYVIVVRLDSGEDVPLWAMTPLGDSVDDDDMKRRTEALLEQLEHARRSPTVRVPTGSVGRPVRLRPVNHGSDFWLALVLTAVALTPVVLGAVFWVLPWWVGGVVLALCVAFGWERGRYLLVDNERIVPVVAGVRGRSIWWDTLDEFSVDRRTPPHGIGVPGAEVDAERGELINVVVARLADGDELPLWAVSGFDDGRSEVDRQRKIDALLARLKTLRPVD